MFARRTATKIKDGRVSNKNRNTKTPNYWNTRQDQMQIDVQKPGKNYKHFLKKRDIIQFWDILPHKEEIRIELDAIVLAEGNEYCDGWYQNGVICICAWEKEMSRQMSYKYFNEHKDVFERLDIKYTVKKNYVICDFNENQIKAFQLLRVMTHEIGHHVDRIRTRSRRKCPRGEIFAFKFEKEYEKKLWNKYFEYFPF